MSYELRRLTRTDLRVRKQKARKLPTKACSRVFIEAKMSVAGKTRARKGDGAKMRTGTISNCSSALEKDLGTRIRWSEFRAEVQYLRETGWTPITDHDLNILNMHLEGEHAIKASMDTLHRAVTVVARSHPHHEVRGYLAGLTWDGVERLDKWLSTYLGVDDTELTRAIGPKWLISCVARAYQPGSKVDSMLILVGAKGLRKSSTGAALVPEAGMYCDTAFDLRSKDAFQALHGVWIYEIAELKSLSAPPETVKGFLTSAVDRYRAPYARIPSTHPRMCVFLGTTNDFEFLRDSEGDRRYWPVVINRRIDTVKLAKDRDQLWAEAVRLYQSGCEWWLSSSEENTLAIAQLEYMQGDPWDVPIGKLLEANTNTTEITTTELLSWMSIEASDRTRSHDMRAAGVLTRLGWTRRRAGRDTPGRPWIYVRPST